MSKERFQRQYPLDSLRAQGDGSLYTKFTTADGRQFIVGVSPSIHSEYMQEHYPDGSPCRTISRRDDSELLNTRTSFYRSRMEFHRLRNKREQSPEDMAAYFEAKQNLREVERDRAELGAKSAETRIWLRDGTQTLTTLHMYTGEELPLELTLNYQPPIYGSHEEFLFLMMLPDEMRNKPAIRAHYDRTNGELADITLIPDAAVTSKPRIFAGDFAEATDRLSQVAAQANPELIERFHNWRLIKEHRGEYDHDIDNAVRAVIAHGITDPEYRDDALALLNRTNFFSFVNHVMTMDRKRTLPNVDAATIGYLLETFIWGIELVSSQLSQPAIDLRRKEDGTGYTWQAYQTEWHGAVMRKKVDQTLGSGELPLIGGAARFANYELQVSQFAAQTPVQLNIARNGTTIIEATMGVSDISILEEIAWDPEQNVTQLQQGNIISSSLQRTA